ncbi:uncharacterized protein LOC144149223 [Haemaphysalis longicornis]
MGAKGADWRAKTSLPPAVEPPADPAVDYWGVIRMLKNAVMVLRLIRMMSPPAKPSFIVFSVVVLLLTLAGVTVFLTGTHVEVAENLPKEPFDVGDLVPAPAPLVAMMSNATSGSTSEATEYMWGQNSTNTTGDGF